MDKIVIKGAKENNLKNINITLPRDKMIVLTGLSGSGKSSLAFDTIYAEGQRRYVESLSSYARMFLGQMDKPDVEYIEGLSPSISIDQRTTSNNPRSTVGTVTEIYDYLRLLFSKIGRPYCPVCGRKIERSTIDQMVDKVMELPEKTRIHLMAPIVKGKKGQHKKLMENIKKEGYNRVLIDGEVYDLFEEIELDKNKKHDISIIVDRIVVKPGIESRVTNSIETILDLTDGLLVIDNITSGEKISLNANLTCPEGHVTIDEISTRMFSFNSPYGACPECNGLGFHRRVDPKLVIPNKGLSLNEGAIAPYSNSQKGTFYYEMIRAVADLYNFDYDTPLEEAPKGFIDAILYGTGSKIVRFNFNSHFSGANSFSDTFEGVVANLERRYISRSDSMKKRIEEYMADIECSVCHGARLKPEVLSIKIDGKNIYDITKMSIDKSYDWINSIELKEGEKLIGEPIVKEVSSRFKFLIDVGLDYLTLARSAGTLSGGESQRIRLATQIGSGLTGVLYVLDEPSIGLHQRDNEKLLKSLRNLTDMGNTLIIVEHDEDTMKKADYIVDIGPKAGIHGGEIVAQGTYEDIVNNENSITGQYLSHKKFIKVPEERRKNKGFIEVKGCRENNLKNIDVKIPLGVLTCITGVSGSGKSSLLEGIIYPALSNRLNNSRLKSGDFDSIKGLDQVDKVVEIDQSPIGKTPRSNPATYTKVFDQIREVFAMTNEAKMRGYDKGRFSFNVKGGRCEACKGDGTVKVEMHFLPDVYVPCEVCGGKRYNRETLQVKYKGKTISDVLDMTVEEALDFFENHKGIERKLQTMYDVGLGYIKIGQSSTELSGGEAQRVKLASELGKVSTGKTVYILDEPTTGLHTADIHKLVDVLSELVDKGNTIIVIEHNLDVIKVSDYIIDLGKEGGDGGGNIIASGTPEDVAKNKESYTGKFLAPLLKRDRVR